MSKDVSYLFVDVFHSLSSCREAMKAKQPQRISVLTLAAIIIINDEIILHHTGLKKKFISIEGKHDQCSLFLVPVLGTWVRLVTRRRC